MTALTEAEERDGEVSIEMLDTACGVLGPSILRRSSRPRRRRCATGHILMVIAEAGRPLVVAGVNDRIVVPGVVRHAGLS